MTVSAEDEAEIRRLFFAEHWKKGTIAAQLEIHRDVVERVVGPLGCDPKAGRRPRNVDPYRAVIEETLGRYPTVVATRVFDMLVKRGYAGSLESVRRVVRECRPPRPREVYARIETLAGEQSQIDWAQVGHVRVPGGKRPLYCFVLLLRHSRAFWAELVLEQTTVSLRRSLVRAARYFGGVTREWLFDNPRSIVVARERGAIRFQDLLVDLAAELHVALRACRVRKPTDKGGVERAIRYLKTRFFAARPIHSLETGNAELREFMETVALERRHPNERERTVGDVLAEEKLRLLPLPSDELPTDLVTSVAIDKTNHFVFDGNRYSIPSDRDDRELRLVASDTLVRVHDDRGNAVAEHARCWGKGQRIRIPEHEKALRETKPGTKDGLGRERLRIAVPRALELMQRWLEDGRNVGPLVHRTTKLLDLYGAQVVGQAVDELLERGSHDYGALAMLCEKRRKRPRPVLPLDLAPHVVERDVIPHDLGGYDDDAE